MLRLAAILLVAAILIPLHVIIKFVTGRSPMPMLFLNAIGWCAGLRISTRGVRLKRHVLFAANHVSWLDILALGGAARSAFVSKAEVARWPVVGWLADQNETIYIERDVRRTVHHQASTLRDELARGHPVTLFPEGTTGDGHHLLPFRPSLFAAVAPPPPGVRIQPVLLDYGHEAPGFAWTDDEPTPDNFRRILSRRGTIALTIHYLDPLSDDVTHDRKSICTTAVAAIAERLATAIPASRVPPVRL